MNPIPITHDERYEFIKLYDILRDMDFELTPLQESVFDDYCGYFDKLPDNEFLDEARDYWEDELPNIISDIKGENQPTMEWD